MSVLATALRSDFPSKLGQQDTRCCSGSSQVPCLLHGFANVRVLSGTSNGCAKGFAHACCQTMKQPAAPMRHVLQKGFGRLREHYRTTLKTKTQGRELKRTVQVKEQGWVKPSRLLQSSWVLPPCRLDRLSSTIQHPSATQDHHWLQFAVVLWSLCDGGDPRQTWNEATPLMVSFLGWHVVLRLSTSRSLGTISRDPRRSARG